MGEKVDGLRIGSSSMSSGGDHRVRRTSAEELTAFGVEREGQWTRAVGVVLGDVSVICAEAFTALLDVLLQLITNGLIEFVTVSEVSGQEASVERHELISEKNSWLVS